LDHPVKEGREERTGRGEREGGEGKGGDVDGQRQGLAPRS